MSDLASFDLGLPPGAERLAKRLFGLKRAESIYADLQLKGPLDPGAFCENALQALGVSIELPELSAFRRLEGPVLFVANHPFGAIDALVLMAIMGKVRQDFKFVGNSILTIFPELKAALFPVHIMAERQERGTQTNPDSNVAAMKRAHRHLKQGGVLGMFPAGEVAAFDSWRSRKPTELAWHPHLGRLVQSSRATVVPLFFEGRNSLLFQYLGLTWPDLRIALLAREMLDYRRPVRFKLGAPIPFTDFEEPPESPESVTLRLRGATFALDSPQ